MPSRFKKAGNKFYSAVPLASGAPYYNYFKAKTVPKQFLWGEYSMEDYSLSFTREPKLL